MTKVRVVAIEYKKDMNGKSEITEIMRAVTSKENFEIFMDSLDERDTTLVGNIPQYLDVTNGRYYAIHHYLID